MNEIEKIISGLKYETKLLLLKFLVGWNLIEHEIFADEYTKDKRNEWKDKVLKCSNVDFDKFSNLWIELKKYLDYKYGESCACDIFKRNDGDKAEIENIYKSDNVRDHLILLFWFTYRIRCRMFHGHKQILNINNQNRLFEYLNNFLELIIETNLILKTQDN